MKDQINETEWCFAERQIIRGIQAGLHTDIELANHVGLRLGEVAVFINGIMRSLNISTRVELVNHLRSDSFILTRTARLVE